MAQCCPQRLSVMQTGCDVEFWVDKAQFDQSGQNCFPERAAQRSLMVASAEPAVFGGVTPFTDQSHGHQVTPTEQQRGFMLLRSLLRAASWGNEPRQSCFSICFWICSLCLMLTRLKFSFHRPPLALFAQPLTLHTRPMARTCGNHCNTIKW